MQQQIVFNLPESVSQEAPQSQASPHVLCWIPLCMNLRLQETPQLTAALFNERCPIRYYPVLVTKTAGAFSLSGTQHPRLTPWQLCHCSLIIHHHSHLSDRRWKFFVKNIFSRKDRLLFSSDMLYLLWHATVLLFLCLEMLNCWIGLSGITMLYRLFAQTFHNLYINIYSFIHSFIFLHSVVHSLNYTFEYLLWS